MATLKSRRETYHRLSTKLALMDSNQLRALLSRAEEPTYGWGIHQVVRLGRSKVFVKRIPVTDLEYDNMYSTRNLYRLPIYYQYGVGSAGFGAFREIAANIKATNWVLDGSCENFAIMYHHRVVPRIGRGGRFEGERLDGYVRYWNGSANIRRYISDRSEARHEAVLFFEYIPHMLYSWLDRNMNRLTTVMRQMHKTIAFLQANGIVHFDCHFGNIVTDGDRMYLADFGLLLDGQFDLTRTERAFLRENRYYDYGEFLSGLGDLLFARFMRLSEARKETVRQRLGVEQQASRRDLQAALLDNLDALRADGGVRIEGNFAAALHKYRAVMDIFVDFFAAMRGPRKNARYSQAKLRRELKGSGFID